jgi:hypothetical protein
MANDPITTAPHRFSMPLTRSAWIALTAALVLVGVGLRIGLPIYRHQVAIREIERLRDPKLPMDERKAIGIAMSHFAGKNGGQPIDAEFRAAREPAGFDVMVWFVTGRDFFGRARFTPGVYCTVHISK